MGVGSSDGNAEESAGEYVRRRRTAADVGRPARPQRAVDPLCPAQAELQHRFAACGHDHPRGLRRHQRLKVDDVQQGGLEQLGLDQRPLNPKQRLVREDDRSLGNAVEIASEAQLAEIVEKRRLKERPSVVAAKRGQIGEVIALKTQIRHKLHRRGQAGCDRKSAVEGMLAKEQVENSLVILFSGLPMAVGHRELIQIGQQAQRRSVGCRKYAHWLSFLTVLCTNYTGRRFPRHSIQRAAPTLIV